jgi:N-hydroxyarylamine O-acetyltransferase
MGAQSVVALEEYFARIGFRGDPEPNLENLRQLHARHTQTIPFENLDPFLRRPVRLDLASLEQKLIRERRGGYCFEHNLLFGHVLRAMGYSVTNLAARVLWNQPDDAITARSHMLLRVDIEGRDYIADTGFGSLTLTAPLRLQVGIEQSTPHETFRLMAYGDEFLLQASVDDVWRTLYRFNLQEQHQPDYEVTSWYLSNHPRSHFVTGLIAARPAPGGRYTLRNTELAVHDLRDGTERRTLANPAALRAVLEDHFQITLPDEQRMSERLEQLWAA